ncbi:MAG: ABC transporter ATP-binding protein [Saprospiraceae bacterium]|nr:ABC transporter ATP-binding protein [Saprospiraceae bacterium]MBK6565134.1 ABC transporter ATP-binding protein [Saprospiraceae bacterium]MBK7523761.1 ABC transporter ATP-binding protein [Saprospiraceae bacterium]MBK8373275.1 ABC transporter ATP-binding protein [Saprospiraceae bacterium]MBK9045046.1 ABC transporter ATP-binding protein [Saprospiraceae bacterium]
MIEIINLYKTFGKTTALKDVSLYLPAGSCIGLIGPNACGKTTLIKNILSMVVPTKGEILFEGKNIKGDVLYKNNIGYMPQIGRYPENMTVSQVIKMIKNIRKYKGTEDKELYDAFGMEKIAEKKMRTLSGGTTQKVSATLAFLFNPTVLILDEPTAGLDPISSEILREKIIKEREKGKLILITSHLLSELDDLLTNIIFMEESVVVFNKSIKTLFEETGEKRVSKAIHTLLKSGAAS